MDTAEEKRLDAHEIAYYSIRGTSAIENVDKVEKAIEEYAQFHTNEVLDKLEERVKELQEIIFSENYSMAEIKADELVYKIQDLKQ